MYLKRLHLHGFKSFANKTSLDFSPGITGIVGPNGAGKSNLSDSLRWVLGEQSMRQLRGKKSEDVIFAGGRGRAAQGMAEVTLTLDNSTNWLPSEFTEVTVSRRAFRSGESDYSINGARVRLKDMLALLSQARIGHDSYTIIGQGLVDQALSARAEERRGLFEDAAGIRHFQTQRNDAEQRLNQTHDNLSRLHDILSEIEPRLGPLAEQARRANEYIVTRSELDRLLRRWYGHQWRAAREALARAESTESATSAALEQLRRQITLHEEEQAQHRTARETLLRILGDLRRKRGETLARIQGLERDLAVARERLGSLERAEQDLSGEQDHVRQGIAEAEAQVIALQAELEAADADQAEERTAIETLESTIHQSRQHQEREDARLRAAQRDLMQAQARLTAAQSEVTRLRRQRDERQARLATQRASGAEIAARAQAAQERLDALRQEHDARRAELGDRLVARETLQATIAETQSELERCRSELGDAQRERRTLTDRLALLREWAGAAGGGSAAVLAALAELPPEDRPQILGDLAQTARVDASLELALEAALGPFLHALVAASEDDAWRAEALARTRGLARVLIAWPVEAADQPDPQCLVAQLDPATPPAARTVVHQIIGDLRVVDIADPDEMRWSLARVPVATPQGTVVHPAGWLRTAPGDASSASAGSGGESELARARELRDLPGKIRAAEEHVRLYEGLTTNARAALEGSRGELAALEKEIKQREARLSDQAKMLGQVQREAEKVGNESQLQQAVEGQIATELITMDDEIAAAEEHYGEAHAAQRDLAAQFDDLQGESAASQDGLRARQEELAQRRTDLAVRQQAARALEQRIALAREHAHDLASQAERRAERLEEIQRQRADVGAAIDRYLAELEAQRTASHQIIGELQGREDEAAGHDARLGELDAALAAGRVEVTQREADYRRALLEAQRARDAIETLRTQMTEEMDADDLSLIIERDLAEATALASPDSVEEMALPRPHIEPDDPIPPEELPRMRRTIDSARGRLKSLGGYDPEAPRAYEELKTRYEFITAQVRDMEEASARLRAVILELDQTMRRRFEETFHAVNERFQRHFVVLFNGGAARLELTAPRRAAKAEEEDATDSPPEPGVAKRSITGGIEVFVQIPGKKVQDLTLLSGGERSLVSAALLFALLETNPPPFCLLDEVDAALDESNVVRFCEILKTLSHQTQFIVITHNRVTMTHADTLYGVSMAASVSRILSMRMALEPQAQAQSA